jgi:hypothetical protein
MSKWFPDPSMIVIEENPNYLNSVWTGITTPLIHLPLMVWDYVLLPMFGGIVTIGRFWRLAAVSGVLGYSNPTSVEQISATEGDTTTKPR